MTKKEENIKRFLQIFFFGFFFKNPLHFRNDNKTEPKDITPKSFLPLIVLKIAHNQKGNAIIAEVFDNVYISFFIKFLCKNGINEIINIKNGNAGLSLYW